MTRRRVAQRQGRPQSQIVKPMDWVAPIGGWQTNVPLVNMPPTAAAQLVNFFPEAGFVRARNGSQPWLTGISAPVETLMPYSGATQKMYAVAGTSIYDATSAGAVGASVYTVANAHLSFANFTNSGGHWLVCVNGVDTPFLYNGSTWATTSITGPSDPKKLFVVTAYRSRLWFLEQGTANLWFLPTLGITGAAQSVNLGAVMKFGGLPVAINTWTMQVQTGVQQVLCILSNEGELVIYTGSDPTDATNWSLMGTFKLGFPLGTDRCMYQIGGDLAIMTVDGIVPASQAIALDPAASDQASMTKNIAPTWLSTVQSIGRTTQGWQFITYPARRMAIINVPDPALGVYQFVMNTETLAWTLFSGMPSAASWAVFNGNLFFGTTGSGVWQGDFGSSDNTAPIDCLSVGAWTRGGDGLAPKGTTMIGVDCIIDANVSIYAGSSFDYVAKIPSALGTSGVAVAAALWDVALWDVALWSGISPVRLIADAGGVGVVFAPTVRALVKGNASAPSNCMILGGSLHVQMGSGI